MSGRSKASKARGREVEEEKGKAKSGRVGEGDAQGALGKESNQEPTIEKQQFFSTNNGKHSVEINVKIRKNPGAEHSSAQHSPQLGSKASPTPNPSTCTLKRGSWAELLHRPAIAQLTHPPPLPQTDQIQVKGKDIRKSRDRHRDRHKARQPQLSPIPMSTTSRGEGDGDGRNSQDDIVKDYANTISELYQLCTKLKNELTEAHDSKEELLNKLQDVIRENEKLQASSTKSVTQLKENIQTIAKERDEFKLKNELISQELMEHNKILFGVLNAVADVKSCVGKEMEAVKNDMSKEQIPPIRPFKSKRLNDSGGRIDGSASDSSINLFSSSDESSTSTLSQSSFFDRDQSSTQYLNLPKGMANPNPAHQ